MKPISSLICLLLAYIVIYPQPAHAYIDLGAGSYIMQLIAGFLASGLFLLKRKWNKLLKWFKENKSKGN
jgi:hypothetical protein